MIGAYDWNLVVYNIIFAYNNMDVSSYYDQMSHSKKKVPLGSI